MRFTAKGTLHLAGEGPITGNRLLRLSSKDRELIYTAFAKEELGVRPSVQPTTTSPPYCPA